MDAPFHNKVYIEIVKKIRYMIEQDGLKKGDKIPSERELSERLHVGRSSVREALRALELLGLIETRRGEGTFLRDAKTNRLVELLSSFILQDEKAIKDVKETKFLIEMDCLRLIIHKKTDEKLKNLMKLVQEDLIQDEEFFLNIVKLADNHLFYRIWLILSDFYRSLNMDQGPFEKRNYEALIEALLTSDEKNVLEAYKKLRKLSI
ncbi:FadR/GntR family transcriptional regulator [Bacillus dakarensis]|uniref:FadR/GntR family transcriptional regulator n=1 Tax=Robertmurraya dakarensis TaxID=1926278 RepID=UPI000981D850|nr:GntR family transcriptional regulator [Bacillus dakarensis]